MKDEAIQKAAAEGKLNKRQARAFQRLSERKSISQAAIEHMLGLMGHVIFGKSPAGRKRERLVTEK